MNDTVDKLVVFLAKRDGIDKLVKTFQYVSKLVHWQAEASRPDLARRAKSWEVASGLSRKAFRSGRFLTGFNALRRSPGSTPLFRFLAVFANAGEMVYFFFDHFLWLSRVGVLDAGLARRMSYVSAFGEALGYVFFVAMDAIMIKKGLAEEATAAQEEEVRRIRAAWSQRGLVGEIRHESFYFLVAFSQLISDFLKGDINVGGNNFSSYPVSFPLSQQIYLWAWVYQQCPCR
ncbi:hypothetical protein ZIOFF_001619 [Zingiber officinale]|uniref:Peroxisomal membrane protein 11B n=1 Tax=Zingiber officinale TaxID=94328 RepID=A0A8J5HV37_ZINOF|nr:hypothetical protein ZIOFF_001619 [Zingiber officinale]